MQSNNDFENNVTFKGIRMIKIRKFVSFVVRDAWDSSQKYEERVRKFSFLALHLLKQNCIVIFISLSLVNICQNYIG